MIAQATVQGLTDSTESASDRLLNTLGLDIGGPQQLLHNNNFQKLISVTPAQIERLNDLEKAYWEETAKMTNKAFEEGLEPEDITPEMHAPIHQRRIQAQEKLLDNKQKHQLLEIGVAITGPLSMFWDEMQGEIEIKLDQKKQLAELRSQYAPKANELKSHLFALNNLLQHQNAPSKTTLNNPLRPKNAEIPLTREEVQDFQSQLEATEAELQAFREQTADQIKKILTKEQVRRFNQYVKKIKPFDFSLLTKPTS